MPKKKRNNRQANDKKNSALKEQTANCKKYLDLDLSSKSAGSLLKYKFLLDSLTEAIELKDNTDESSTNKLRDLYLNINKNLLNLDIENVKAKSDLKPLEKDLETAKELKKTKQNIPDFLMEFDYNDDYDYRDVENGVVNDNRFYDGGMYRNGYKKNYDERGYYKDNKNRNYNNNRGRNSIL